jgi:hypothetical protein
MSTGRKILRSPFFWMTICALLMYGLATLIVPRTPLFLVMNALMFAVSIGVVVIALPAVKAAFTAETPEPGDRVVLGLVGLCISNAFLRGWTTIMLDAGRPSWMIDHPFLGLALLLGVGSGLMVLNVPAKPHYVPEKRWIRAGVIVAVGAFMAFLAIWYGEHYYWHRIEDMWKDR